MIRPLIVGECVHIRLLPGQVFAGLVLEGTVLSAETMPTQRPRFGHSLFPRGSRVYVLKPTCTPGTPGRHHSIRLGEHEIEEMPSPTRPQGRRPSSCRKRGHVSH